MAWVRENSRFVIPVSGDCMDVAMEEEEDPQQVSEYSKDIFDTVVSTENIDGALGRSHAAEMLLWPPATDLYTFLTLSLLEDGFRPMLVLASKSHCPSSVDSLRFLLAAAFMQRGQSGDGCGEKGTCFQPCC
ncbi:unnamed protein product [Symbiodinium sp. CCMP2592]|nr:unnamed protein product [Symbiodinium sp. CCMP2592]